MHEARAQFGLLSWTHYRILTQVDDPDAREWYAKELRTVPGRKDYF